MTLTGTPMPLGKRQIYCVGLGVKELSHLTLESLSIIEKAQFILHIGLEGRRLNQLNPNTRSLEKLYWSGRQDWDTYKTIAKLIVDTARSVKGSTVFATEGNPAIFNDITWEIVARATKSRIPVRILPGISCLDVLPIDLYCDLGDVGAQIFEANQLVLYDLSMNPYLSTFILQVGWFGISVLTKSQDRRPDKLDPLIEHLLKFYSEKHPAIFAMSAIRPGKPCVVFQTTVGKISRYAPKIHSAMTLYLPRQEVRVKNYAFYRFLKKRQSLQKTK